MAQQRMKEIIPEPTTQELALARQEQAQVMATQMVEAGISPDDIVIPRLMLMQNTSEYVGDGKAKMGDIMNAQSMTVVGGINTPVEIVPLKMFKTIRIYDVSQQPPKFIRQEPATPATEKLPFEGNEGGVAVKRYLNLNFYILMKKDIDNDEAFPVVVSFKSTSLRAGKQLATQLFKMLALRKPVYSKSVMLTVTKEKKDTNYYAVFGIAEGSVVDETTRAKAEEWLANIGTMKVQEDVDPTDTVTAPAVERSGSNDLY